MSPRSFPHDVPFVAALVVQRIPRFGRCVRRRGVAPRTRTRAAANSNAAEGAHPYVDPTGAQFVVQSLIAPGSTHRFVKAPPGYAVTKL